MPSYLYEGIIFSKSLFNFYLEPESALKSRIQVEYPNAGVISLNELYKCHEISKPAKKI